MSLSRVALVAVASCLLAIEVRAADHAVRIDEWATPMVVSEVPKEIGASEALWIWSDNCAPRRVTAMPAGDCPDADAVEVRVTTRARTRVAGLQIRWGTEEMLGEMPDAMLPIAVLDESGRTTIRVPKGATAFGRVVGPTLASRWKELHAPGGVLDAVDGVPVNIALRDAQGKPAVHSHLEIRTTDTASVHDLPFTGAGDRTIQMPPIPSGAYVRLLAWSDRDAPVSAVATTDRLPATIALAPGVVLRGRLVDSKHMPIAGVDLRAAFRIPPADMIEKRARSDGQGRFSFEGLEPREIEWRAKKSGFGLISRIVRLKDDVDLGEVMLSPARDVQVSVVNGRREPVPDAVIRTADGITAKTGTKGIATLKQVSSDPFDGRVVAFGYMPRAFHVGEGASTRPISVIMRDSARVRARVVRAADGSPAGPGTIAVELDGRKTLADFDVSGTIDVANLEAGMLSIEIRAPGLSPFRLPPRRIAEGEIVDLGVLSLPEGLALVGRVVDADSNAPLSAVSVHVLRPSTFGPLLSYARHDWTEANSSDDGSFRVGGLAPGVYALWIDAPGHAPLVRSGVELHGTEPDAELDLGDLSLPGGKTLHITCEPAERCGTTAVILVGGSEWLSLKSAMTSDGATIAPVPPGRATLQLWDAGGVVHEREVAIAANDPMTELHIHLPSVDVRGVVSQNGKPVARGTLLFLPIRASRVVQIDYQGTAGSLGTDSYGSVMRAHRAELSDDGTFVLRGVTAGDYGVTWSAGSAQSPPVRVSIADLPEVILNIELPSCGVEGIVRTSGGEPLPSVLITAGQNNVRGQAFAAPDGTFALTGLAPGSVLIRAVSGMLRAEKSLTLEAGRTAHVELTLEPAKERSLTVMVRANGAPLPNAVVFLRENGVTTARTSASDGTATLTLGGEEGMVEAAVYAPLVGWAFVPLQRQTGRLLVDVVQASGAIDITATSGRDPVSLISPTGFPIHEALPLLGIPSVTPLHLQHLPEGMYTVTSHGTTRTVVLAQEKKDVHF